MTWTRWCRAFRTLIGDSPSLAELAQGVTNADRQRAFPGQQVLRRARIHREARVQAVDVRGQRRPGQGEGGRAVPAPAEAEQRERRWPQPRPRVLVEQGGREPGETAVGRRDGEDVLGRELGTTLR